MNGGAQGLSLGGTCAGNNGAMPGENTSAVFTSYDMPESTVEFIPLTLEVSNDTTVCIGDAALLYASGTGTGALTFEWSDGSTGDSIIVYPAGETTYSVTIIDSRGCSITKTVNVDVTSTSVTATAFPDSIIIGNGFIQLTADTVGNEFFSWTPAEWLNDASLWNPVAIPLDTVTYCVEATGYNGCIDTACVNVLVVIPEPALFIPSGFTPNGDGLNDRWQIIANDDCYTIDLVQVWNRWGMLIYDRNSLGGEDWDGNYNGEPQAIETYFYYIKANCTEREGEEEYYGSVILIR